ASSLAHHCLTFDFIGTSTDESADDLCTVQIPSSWRSAFLDFSTLQLFFDLYGSLPYSIPLGHLLSRSNRLCASLPLQQHGAIQVPGPTRERCAGHFAKPLWTHDPNNYHEFCRLLARLKSNYQLGELVLVSYYPEAIRLMAKFTVDSLRLWQFATNSIHYLLSLWQRMVASVPYVKSSEPHLIETYTPEVAQAYITSRLESVEVVVRDNLEDPLEDTGMLSQQLEQLSVIGRCEYTKTCTLLVQLFNSAASSYQEMISNMNTPKIDITIQERAHTIAVMNTTPWMGNSSAGASTHESHGFAPRQPGKTMKHLNHI
ncbi:Uncharacterized protein FKW44_012386, partial [Caligus rogercresseyi]